MRFFLAKQAAIQLAYDGTQPMKGKFGAFAMVYQVTDELDEFDCVLSTKIERMAEQYQCHSAMAMVFVEEDDEPSLMGKLAIQESSNFLKDISFLLGRQNVKVKVVLSLQQTPQPQQQQQQTLRHDYRVRYYPILRTGELTVSNNSYNALEGFLPFPKLSTLRRFLPDSPIVSALMTIEVTVDTTMIRKNDKKEGSGINLYEKLLHEEIHSDVIITTEDGSQVKCHKSVLSACSPVFEAMFKAGLEEAKTSCIKIPDMSQEAVKAMLRFVYYLNEEEPSGKCDIAFELLNAAHKYNVGANMEKAMTNLILSKPVEWFDVDVAVKLFLLARNLPNNGDRLKAKAVQVMKRNSDSLQNSEFYAEMFQKNAAAAMELCQILLSSLKSYHPNLL